ncbi:MAG: tetratricopeptide repeat protein [Rhodospirillaceae bacterium]
MSALSRITLVFIVLLLAASVAAADFEKGVAAYDRGDYATALREWRPLAKQGDAIAQFNLGTLYNKGRGVPQDFKKAVKWYRKAAEQGDAKAQYNLGIIYDNGQDVPQDYEEAAKWYRKAAEQGDVRAQYNLGVMYGQGHGVLLNYIKAHMWFNLAAANGHKLAIKGKDIAANILSSADVSKAQAMAREWIKKFEERKRK